MGNTAEKEVAKHEKPPGGRCPAKYASDKERIGEVLFSALQSNERIRQDACALPT